MKEARNKTPIRNVRQTQKMIPLFSEISDFTIVTMRKKQAIARMLDPHAQDIKSVCSKVILEKD